MATYYIDPNADAGGDGTTKALSSGDNTHAFNTWSGLTTQAGNTYLQRAGTTVTSGIIMSVTATVGSPNVFGSYTATKDRSYEGSVRPILDGTGLGGINGFIAAGHEYYTVEDLEVKNFQNRGIQGLSNVNGGITHATIRNCHVHNCWSDGIGFYLTLPDTSDQNTDCLVENCITHNNGYFGIAMMYAGTRMTVRNCTSYENGWGGIAWDIWAQATNTNYNLDGGWTADGGGVYHRAYTLPVLNVTQFGPNGVLLTDGGATATPALGEWGVTGGNLYINTGFVPGDEYIIIHNRIMDNVLFENCTAYGNASADDTSIGLDEFASGIIRNCVAHTVGTGISFNLTDTCECYNNIVYDCTGEGILLAGERSTLVYNNVIENCGAIGINFTGDDTDGTKIHNNIIIGGVDGIETNGATNLIESNNCFYNQSGSAFPTGTMDPSDIESDPLLGSDYRPTLNSPCIDAGTTSLSNKDFYGANKVRFNTDIGAVWYDSHAGTTNKKNLASGGNK